MEARVYELSPVWAVSLAILAIGSSAFMINAAWGAGAEPGRGATSLRIAATFVAVGSVLILRLVYVMARRRELLRVDGRGVHGREPAGVLWATAAEFSVAWERFAGVSVSGGRVVQVLKIWDLHGRQHAVNMGMLGGWRSNQARQLGEVIVEAHADWRQRSQPGEG